MKHLRTVSLALAAALIAVACSSGEIERAAPREPMDTSVAEPPTSAAIPVEASESSDRASAEAPAVVETEESVEPGSQRPTAQPAVEDSAPPVKAGGTEPADSEPADASPPKSEAPVQGPVGEPAVAVADTDHNGLAGVRGLTLQWISWEPEEWGQIEFVPLVDGTYAVSGAQQGPDGDFVTVDGTIVKISDRELLLTGVVTVQVSYLFGGEPCTRTGELTFLATGDRQFWRMQDLESCDEVVDYVDIYFG